MLGQSRRAMIQGDNTVRSDSSLPQSRTPPQITHTFDQASLSIKVRLRCRLAKPSKPTRLALRPNPMLPSKATSDMHLFVRYRMKISSRLNHLMSTLSQGITYCTTMSAVRALPGLCRNPSTSHLEMQGPFWHLLRLHQSLIFCE